MHSLIYCIGSMPLMQQITLLLQQKNNGWIRPTCKMLFFHAYKLYMKIPALISIGMIVDTMYENFYVYNVLKCIQIKQFKRHLATSWKKISGVLTLNIKYKALKIKQVFNTSLKNKRIKFKKNPVISSYDMGKKHYFFVIAWQRNI